MVEQTFHLHPKIESMNNISPENAFNLSKREYLAAKFLQGLLSSADASFFCGGNSEQINHMFLSRAVDLADEFLEYFDSVYVIDKKPKYKINEKVYLVFNDEEKLMPSEIENIYFDVTKQAWEYEVKSRFELWTENNIISRIEESEEK
ncbi:hypothetical protein [Gloeothece verrucosa]|uniref:Peptidase S16, lon domain-containing protein n=1 Tax=Gloeothece verrucosa (strain PCC 7822) TaxID=497965 RepID=E0UJ66_GLOV7|nr:hypothetical protein [Gloeothece verrucosa]ADN15769.1 peptidase S16, lon domain-containing protein [Gloeothece verrucosa PCC 7822]